MTMIFGNLPLEIRFLPRMTLITRRKTEEIKKNTKRLGNHDFDFIAFVAKPRCSP